jgi:MOSC domain-containing protein YiiM
VKIISVNISGGGPLDMGNKTIKTGIDKRAVPSARVGMLGLESDVVANKKHHGGPDQAVYVYGSTGLRLLGFATRGINCAGHIWRELNHFGFRERRCLRR